MAAISPVCTRGARVSENGTSNPGTIKDVDDRTAAAATASSFAVSKAALRRLAHDAGTRMLKSHYETGMTALVEFLQEVIRHACIALTYSKRKSINTDHIYYALKVAKIQLPSELHDLQNDELKTLKKCNVHADWLHRKNTMLAVEISEASFKRLVKQIGAELNLKVHFTVQARHLLQLIAEVCVVRTFAEHGSEGTANKPSSLSSNRYTSSALAHNLNSAPLAHACQAMLDFDAHVGHNCSTVLSDVQLERATYAFNTTVAHIPSLLQLSSSRTVDKRLMQTAVQSLNIDMANLAEIHTARSPVVKIICKILRGQLVDKRITASAMTVLCNVVHNTIRNAPETHDINIHANGVVRGGTIAGPEQLWQPTKQ